jgi:hypothetical protein
MRRIVALSSLVVIGIVSLAAAGCGQRDPGPTSTMLKTSTAAQGDGVSYSTQPDATPTAIEAAANGLSQELLSIRGIAGVGIGQSAGSPCLRVYLENGSTALRSRVPTQFRGFPVVQEVTGPIEALPAQAATASPHSAADKVELDIFSGRPNPTWVLTPAQASDLTSRIARLHPATAVGQRPDNLGYRGFIVQTTTASSPSSAMDRTIRAYSGIVEVVDSTGTAYYRDPQRQIELWLLTSAKPPLGGDLTTQIVKAITK